MKIVEKIIITSILKKKCGSGQERELKMYTSVNLVLELMLNCPLVLGNSVPCTLHLPPLAGSRHSVYPESTSLGCSV